MSYMYVCNLSSDCLSKIDLQYFKEECRIELGHNKNERIGPHDSCIYNDKLIVANCYNNTISLIDISKDKYEESFFVGSHCNGVVTFKNYAYIICGDLNNVTIFDLETYKFMEQIPCGNLPHNIEINKKINCIAITNMDSDSVTLIDCKDNSVAKEIKVGPYPTKSLFSPDGNYLYVCESNLGSDSKGSISIISVKNCNLIQRISVGNSPIDMFCNCNYCFISNFGEGSISIVDVNNYKELKKIIVGGMPRGIISYNGFIYVGDNYNNLLMQIDIKNKIKKVICIGGEPTGMTLV